MRNRCTVPWSEATHRSAGWTGEGAKARPLMRAGVDPLRKECTVSGEAGACTRTTVPFCEAEASSEPVSLQASTAWGVGMGGFWGGGRGGLSHYKLGMGPGPHRMRGKGAAVGCRNRTARCRPHAAPAPLRGAPVPLTPCLCPAPSRSPLRLSIPIPHRHPPAASGVPGARRGRCRCRRLRRKRAPPQARRRQGPPAGKWAHGTSSARPPPGTGAAGAGEIDGAGTCPTQCAHVSEAPAPQLAATTSGLGAVSIVRRSSSVSST